MARTMIRPLICLKELWSRLMNVAQRKTTSVVATTRNRVTTGFQASLLRATAGGGQDFSARRTNWNDTGPSTEIETAKRFSEFVGNGLTHFEKAPEYDDVDIKGKSADGAMSEEFQITRLWDGKFWRQLNATGATDMQLSREELSNLILDAVERKGKKYASGRRKMLILLIDATPEGVLPSLIPSIRSDLKVALNGIGFKQVWLVGSDKEKTTQLSSS
jgi:hypothetical protein